MFTLTGPFFFISLIQNIEIESLYMQQKGPFTGGLSVTHPSPKPPLKTTNP
jgi:hypothetical protein